MAKKKEELSEVLEVISTKQVEHEGEDKVEITYSDGSVKYYTL